MAAQTQEARRFSDKLRAALREQDISVRALARRMSHRAGTPLEQERRRLHRYLAEPPMMATEQSRRLIEECLQQPAGSLDSDEDDEESALPRDLEGALRVLARYVGASASRAVREATTA